MGGFKRPVRRGLVLLGLVPAASSCTGADGPCSGLPDPVTLLDEAAALGIGHPGVYDLAVDRDYVYWSDYSAGKIRRVDKAGAGATTLADAAEPTNIAVDDQYVYWINVRGGVRLMPKSGGGIVEVSPDLPCESGNCSGPLAIDDATIYWFDRSRVMSKPKAGGAPVLIDTPALSSFSDLAVDNQSIYWVSVVPQDGLLIPRYAIQATPKAGGRSRMLADFDQRWGEAALDDRNLYIARPDGVWRVRKDGSGTGRMASAPLEPRNIATDGVHVFVAERDKVFSVPVSGGELTPIGCDQVGATYRMVVDESAVYWTDPDAETILALPK